MHFPNTTGIQNTALGQQALDNNTTSSNNTALGYQAAYSQTSPGNPNTAIGALVYSTTTGSGNVSVGYQALEANTPHLTTLHWYQSLQANTTGENNTGLVKEVYTVTRQAILT